MIKTARIFEQEKRKRSKKRKSRKRLTKHCKTNAATFAKLEEIAEKRESVLTSIYFFHAQYSPSLTPMRLPRKANTNQIQPWTLKARCRGETWHVYANGR
ncbi:hypothetical protein [Aeribacillus sp. FSL M8-0254]|uniref:hypothetical protein n=1 Tax=Aeribacillus sp. FSL M8-0254 TaxID=2954577 RepID=UPI0030FCD4E6